MDIKDILKEDFAQKVIQEFGLEGESADAQAYLIAKLGENIIGRVFLEIHSLIPPHRKAEFEALLEKGDPQELQQFIKPILPNFEIFVQQEAQKEIEKTKELMKKAAAAAA